jgi:predicted thioesterase
VPGCGETYGVDVNVTKVEGTDVKFDLKVDDEPQ